MQKARLVFFLTLCNITLAVAGFFDHNGKSSSFGFLKNNPAAKYQSLAGGGVAYGNSIQSAIASNIASAGVLKSHQFFFNYLKTFSSFSSQNLNTSFLLAKNHINYLGGVQFIGYEPIEGFDISGKPTNSYGAFDFKGQLGIAKKIHPLLFAGVSFNFITSQIEQNSFSSLAIDLGIIYHLHPKLHFGLSIRDWDIKTTTPTKVPSTLQSGLAYFQKLNPSWDIVLTSDFFYREDESFSIPIGLEANLKKWLSFRSGYEITQTRTNLPNFGLGFVYTKLIADYSLTLHPYLGNSHLFSFTWGF